MSKLRKEALDLYINGQTNITEISRQLKHKYKLERDLEYYRKYFSKYINKNKDFEGAMEHANEMKIDFSAVDHGWIKTKEASFHFKNQSDAITYEDMCNSLKEGLEDHAISYPKIDYPKQTDEGIMVMISMADLHLGRYAKPESSNSEFDLEIGIQMAHEAIDAIIAKCAPYNVEKWVWVMGNDVMHVSAGRMGGRSTSSGTLQDVDGHWLDHWRAAIDLNVSCIEKLSSIAPTFVSLNPSNHDYHESLMLGSAMQVIMKNHNGVEFDVTPQHRKYCKWGSTVIGTTHGDKARWNKLGELMLYETQDWSSKEEPIRYRYFFTHHIHSKKALDTVGVIIESCLSLTAGDIWHHDQGYLNKAASLECFGFSKTHGQVFRFTHNVPLERGKDGTLSHETLSRNILG